MSRAGTLALLAAVAFGTPALAQPPTCPQGRVPTGDLGIARYLCVGGACRIWSGAGEALAHSFTTEPRVDRIEPGSPADGRLRIGDVLVAVDGRLITTAAAGRLLARLEPGVPVRLWIRRDGRDLHLELVPRRGCNPSGLSVRIPDAG